MAFFGLICRDCWNNGATMLGRHLERELVKWRDSPLRQPLLVRGARQVGKSYLIEQFGKEYFDNVVSINFEAMPDYTQSVSKFGF